MVAAESRTRSTPAVVVVALVLSILYAALSSVCAVASAGLGLVTRTVTANAADAGPKSLADGLVSFLAVGAAASAGLALLFLASVVAAGFAWQGARWSRFALITSFGLAAVLKGSLAWALSGWAIVVVACFAVLDLGVVVGMLRARALRGSRRLSKATRSHGHTGSGSGTDTTDNVNKPIEVLSI